MVAVLAAFLLLICVVSLRAQDETDASTADRTIIGLNHDGAPGMFSTPSPSVTRSGHLVISTAFLASADQSQRLRIPFAVGYGIARYSQAFAVFVNGPEEDAVERDRVLVGLRLFLGNPGGISLGVEGFASSLAEWPRDREHRSGVGGGVRMMAATALPLGIQFTIFGGAAKDPFYAADARAGASMGIGIFDQTLLGAEAEWRQRPNERGSYTAAAGVRAFLFEHVQISVAFQASRMHGTSANGILAGIAFSSDILSTSSSSHDNELPPELPGLEELDRSDQGGEKTDTPEESKAN